jgi:thioredoxin reductase (NADPH)
MIEEEAPGGQAGTSSMIENYLGFPRGLTGFDLARRALDQARRFEVEILTPQQVVGLGLEGQYKKTMLADGGEIVSHVLCLTMGLSWRTLDVPGADRLTGRGVYYGAALSEAVACQDKDVFIVGAGNSAGQAALHFARYARTVVMLVRGDSLGARMSHYLVDRIEKTPNIEVRLRSRIAECFGDDRLEGIGILNDTGEAVERAGSYLFSFIGAAPRTDWLGDCVARDERGFILTGPDLDPARHLAGWPLERQPFLLETNVPGTFAAGDVRHQSIKRVASAVGEGSVTVHFIHQYLASL